MLFTVFAISTAGATHFDCNIEMIKQHRSGNIGLKSFIKLVIACFSALQRAYICDRKIKKSKKKNNNFFSKSKIALVPQ